MHFLSSPLHLEHTKTKITDVCISTIIGLAEQLMPTMLNVDWLQLQETIYVCDTWMQARPVFIVGGQDRAYVQNFHHILAGP
jgi:glutamine amidotransferase-like uncharacterized protein